MRKLWPLVILLLPGCTFFTFKAGNGPRAITETKDLSPGLCVVLGVFILILLMAVGAALFKESDERRDPTKAMAIFIALFAGAAVLLLAG